MNDAAADKYVAQTTPASAPVLSEVHKVLANLAPAERLALAAELLRDLSREQHQMRVDARALLECQKNLQTAEDARQAEFIAQELQAERDKFSQKLAAEEQENHRLKQLLLDAKTGAKNAERVLVDRDAEIHGLKRELDDARLKLENARAAAREPVVDDRRVQLLQAELAEVRQRLERAARDHELQVSARDAQLAQLRQQPPVVVPAPEIPDWLWERVRRCPQLALKESDPPNKATVQRVVEMFDALCGSVCGLDVLVCMTLSRLPVCPRIQPLLQAFQQNSLCSMAWLSNLNAVRMKIGTLEALIRALIVGMDAVLDPKAVMNALREHLHTPGAKWNGFTSLNEYDRVDGPAQFADLLSKKRVQTIEKICLGE